MMTEERFEEIKKHVSQASGYSLGEMRELIAEIERLQKLLQGIREATKEDTVGDKVILREKLQPVASWMILRGD